MYVTASLCVYYSLCIANSLSLTLYNNDDDNHYLKYFSSHSAPYWHTDWLWLWKRKKCLSMFAFTVQSMYRHTHFLPLCIVHQILWIFSPPKVCQQLTDNSRQGAKNKWQFEKEAALTGNLGWTFLLDVLAHDAIPDHITVLFFLLRHNQLKSDDHRWRA